eukprot:scaffold305551_cov31-Attheya_sp.AAC.1
MAGARVRKEKNPKPEDSYKLFKIKELNKNCSHCLVSVGMEAETIGFATTLHFKCKTESEHQVSVTPQKVSPHIYSGQEVSHGLYWVNYLIVLMMHRIGCGMYHAQLIAGFLGLPTFKTVPYMFRVVEEKLGAVLGQIAVKSQQKALE